MVHCQDSGSVGFWLSIGSDSVSSILFEVAVGVSGLPPSPHGFSFGDRDLVFNK